MILNRSVCRSLIVPLLKLREPAGRPNWLLVLFLAAYCLLFTVVYLVFKDPYIHEVNHNEGECRNGPMLMSGMGGRLKGERACCASSLVLCQCHHPMPFCS